MTVICSKGNWNISQIKIKNFTKSSNGIGFLATKFFPFKLHRNCRSITFSDEKYARLLTYYKSKVKTCIWDWNLYFIRYFEYCNSLSKHFFPIFFFTLTPSVIIYDIYCNLHTYCLNRDPHCFKDTLFVVDRFHWYNH